jgi:hypothetical protein
MTLNKFEVQRRTYFQICSNKRLFDDNCFAPGIAEIP